MADKDERVDIPIIRGQVYIEVEYDYEYTSKEKRIVIKQGEKYILLKKTNDDWWQVKKDETSKPFYVPAQYVKEIPRKALMPPVKPLVLQPGSTLKPKLTEAISKSPEVPNSGKPFPFQSSVSSQVRDANQNFSQNISPGQNIDHVQNNVKINNELQPSKVPAQSKPFSLGRFPDFESLEVEKTSFSHEQSWDSTGEGSEKFHLDSESGDEYSSSSTEHIQATTPTGQVRPDSPVYTNLQELKITQSTFPPQPTSSPIQVNGEWETHKDTATGRCYYFNRVTQERTWKPPRTTGRDTLGSKADSHNLGEHEHLSSEENCHSLSDSHYGSAPRGWSEELDEHGQTLYVSDYTNEKWIKHVDDQGRPYYYSTDGMRSEWELPKYNISPQQPGEIAKSRSLDRKVEPIVLTKWRHSTCVLDSNEKSAAKLERTSSEYFLNTAAHLVHPYPQQESPTTPKQIFSDSELSPPSPKQPNSVPEKCGLLNITKITDNGKKVRKNWTSSWTVLNGSSLSYSKNQGSGGSWKFGSNPSKPEFVLDLRGGSIDWASKDKSSKKHVIEVKTRQGTELLIHSENDTTINEWYKALLETVNRQVGNPDEPNEDEVPESPSIEKLDKEKEQRESKKNRSLKSSASVDAAEQKKTKTKLKKFLTRRPTLQAVREKGYIKDQVFGSNLAELCKRENTTVPKFVKLCLEHVEKHGLNVDGLYRVSGNLAIIQKLRFAVNHDEKLDLNDSKWEDIHVITGALKMFFRELPEPLFTYNHFDDFVTAIKTSDYKQRVSATMELIKQLPKPNQDTMQALFKHLKKVIDSGEANRMNTQSIAIVFGPTLLRPEKETASIAVHMVYQNQIVELILMEVDSIFGH
ncbi:rho GTPase-activating protein 12 isoform X2 [Protopterus annectens]|uniref:rho GTPase-activating protein 12 isoform X2 n=1 Tax=Protopterus annectens TaxID=7888 RepID=UPI001CF9B882|nr:rho GTPase-activating protein 12 isoform X2 [Protopterus annectens]